MVGRPGFEPGKAKPGDLQSPPVGHLGTCPILSWRSGSNRRPTVYKTVALPAELLQRNDLNQRQLAKLIVSLSAALCSGLPSCLNHGAGGGNRTRVASLENSNSTIELHPQKFIQPLFALHFFARTNPPQAETTPAKIYSAIVRLAFFRKDESASGGNYTRKNLFNHCRFKRKPIM
jgi:hypothetical protein